GGPSARAFHGNAHLPSLFFRPRGTASREGCSCTTFPAGSRIRAPIPRLHAADAIFELERAPSAQRKRIGPPFDVEVVRVVRAALDPLDVRGVHEQGTVHAHERRAGKLRFPYRESTQDEHGSRVGRVDLRVIARGPNEHDIPYTDEARAPLVGMEEEIVVPIRCRLAVAGGFGRRPYAAQ